MVGFNETCIVIGSNVALPITGSAVKVLASWATQVHNLMVEKAQEQLCTLAMPLCKSAGEMGLPPMHTINHRIDLIDDDKVYLVMGGLGLSSKPAAQD